MAQKENTSLPPPASQDPPLTAEEVQGQLQRILASPEFHATLRQREFLQFVVTETLAGRAKEIKAYTVATHVFGRKKNFNQSIDPVVSIQANGLRRALERYYLVTGKQDPVCIEIPRGTYVPIFYANTRVESGGTALVSKIPDVGFEDSWPAVLVRPFENLTGDREKDYWGIGLATELAVEITRFQEIRVLLYSHDGHGKALSHDIARFVIDGNMQQDRTAIKLTVRLTDTKTGKQIWGDTHWSDLKAAELLAFEEEIARVVAAKIAGEYGIIAQTLSYESRTQPPSELKTYEAILRYYEYDQTLTSESFIRALAALEHAASVEPRCGQVWSLLGRLYANIYSLELPGFETALGKAVEFAEKGVRLNPHDQRTRAVLALVRMFSNEIQAARAEVEKAYALSPNSLFMLDGLGYLMTLLGDWKRGVALIRKVMDLNPFYRNVVHYALWVDWIRQEEYEQAHLETLNFRRPAVFWDPLAKAVTLGQLGRVEEGKRPVEDLLKLKPDFPSRGRILIRHYIKFEDLVERVTDGLRKAGLNIEDA